jgi:hypothetical protein
MYDAEPDYTKPDLSEPDHAEPKQGLHPPNHHTSTKEGTEHN